MATEVSVDLQEILLASKQMGDMADVYGGAIAKLKQAADGGSTWEKPESASAWSDFVDGAWNIFANSQDNLNAASRTMVHYINEVCEQDSSNRDDLNGSVEDYNAAVRSALDTNNDGEVSEKEQQAQPDLEELPEPDDDPNKDPIAEPDYDEADRPEGN